MIRRRERGPWCLFVAFSFLLASHAARAQEGTLRFSEGAYVTLPDIAGVQYQGNMGFDFWFYLDEISSQPETLFGAGADWDNGAALYVEGTDLIFRKCHSGTCKTLTPTSALRARRWHHIVFGKHSGNQRIRVWLDGASVLDVVDPFFHESAGQITSLFFVGKGPDTNASQPFNGLMDELRFWSQYPDIRIYESFTQFYLMGAALSQLSTSEILDGDPFMFGTAQSALALAYDGTLQSNALLDGKSDWTQNSALHSGVTAYVYTAPGVTGGQTFRANNLFPAGGAFGIVALSNPESSYITFDDALEPEGRFRVLPADHLLAVNETPTLAWSETSTPSTEVPDQLVDVQLVASDGRFEDEENAQITIFGGVPPKAPHVQETFLEGDLSAGPGGIAGVLHVADVNEDLIVSATLTLPDGIENDLVFMEYSPGEDVITLRWKEDLLSSLKSDSFHALESYPFGESGNAERCDGLSLISEVIMQIGLGDNQGYQETYPIPLYFRASDPRPTFAAGSSCDSLSCPYVLGSWDIATETGYQTFAVSELIAGTEPLQNHTGPLGQDESQLENQLGLGVWCDASCRSGRWQYAESSAAVTALGADAWHDISSDAGTSCIPVDTFGYWVGCSDWNGNLSQNQCDCPQYYHQTHYPFLLLPPEALLRYRHDHGISARSEIFDEDSLQIKIWDGQQGGAFRTWVGEHETYCTRKGSLSGVTHRLEPHTVESEIPSQVLGLNRTTFVEPCQSALECSAGEACFDGYCRISPNEPCTENWDCMQGAGECVYGSITGCATETCGQCFYDDPRGFILQGTFSDGNLTDMHRVEVTVHEADQWFSRISDVYLEDDEESVEGTFSFRLHVLPNFSGDAGITIKIFEADVDATCSQTTQCGPGKECVSGYCFGAEPSHSFQETIAIQGLPDDTVLNDYGGRGFRSGHTVSTSTAHYLQIGEMTETGFTQDIPDIHFERIGTAELWFRPASFESQSVYPLLQNWNNGLQIRLTSSGARLCFLSVCSVEGEPLWANGETDVPWMHLAMTLTPLLEQREIRLYRDGMPIRIEGAEGDGFAKSITLPEPKTEGMHVGYASGSVGTNAYFDEVRLWTQVHPHYSDETVAADKKRFYVPRVDEAGLLVWFDFDHLESTPGAYRIRNRASAAEDIAAQIFHVPGNAAGVIPGTTSAKPFFRMAEHAAFVVEAKTGGPDALFFPLVSWFSQSHPDASSGQMYPDLSIPEDSQTIFVTKWHDADFGASTTVSLVAEQGDSDRLQIESFAGMSHAFLLRPDLNFAGTIPDLALGFAGDPNVSSDDRITYFDVEIVDIPEPMTLKTGVPDYQTQSVQTCEWNEGQEQACTVDLDAYFFDEDSEDWTVEVRQAETLEESPAWLSSALAGHVVTLAGNPQISCLAADDTQHKELWFDVCDEQPSCARIAVSYTVQGRNNAPVQVPGARYGFLTSDESAATNAITEDDVDTSGRRISEMLYDYVDDDDSCTGIPEQAGLAIFGAAVAYGQWEYRLSQGAPWLAIEPRLAVGQGLVLTQDAYVRYVPDGAHGLPAGAELGAYVWDGTGGAESGDVISLDLRGGRSPFAEHSRTYVLRVDEVSEPIRLVDGIPSSAEGIAWICDTWTEEIAWAEENPAAVNRCAIDTSGWFQQDEGEDLFFALVEMTDTRNFDVSQNDDNRHQIQLLGQGGVSGLPLGAVRDVDLILRVIEPATAFHDARSVEVGIRVPVRGQNNAPVVIESAYALPETSKGLESDTFQAGEVMSSMARDDDSAAGESVALGLAVSGFTGTWEWRPAEGAEWTALSPIPAGMQSRLFPATTMFRFAAQQTEAGEFELTGYVWDQSTGIPYAAVAEGKRGENSAFSIQPVQISLSVLERNLPPLVSPTEPITVVENTTGELGQVLLIQDDDAALNQLLSVRVISENTEGFAISPDGILSVDTVLDYEVAAQHELLVEVKDGTHPAQSFSILVFVQDEDDTAPEIQNCPAEITISSSHEPGEILFVPELYDPDTYALQGVFTLTQDGASVPTFSVSDEGLRVTVGADVYLERVPSRQSMLHISVSDGENIRPDACTIPVHYNSAPVIRLLDDTSWQLSENALPGTLFGPRLEAQDEEEDLLSWTVLEPQVISQKVVWLPSENFELDLDAMQISSKTATDFELKSTHPLRLQVMDAFSAKDALEFAVYITDVDEPPYIEDSISVLSVPQTVRVNEVISRLPVQDPEGMDLYFSTSNPDFAVSENGALSVRTNAFSSMCASALNCRPLYDRVSERFELSVTVRDGAHQRNFVFELVVVDVDEAPIWQQPASSDLVVFDWEHAVPGEVSFRWAATDPDSVGILPAVEQVDSALPYLESFRSTPTHFYLNVSALPPSQSAFTLRVSDGERSTDREFTLHVFERDQDEDGLSDSFESHFGLSVLELDSDGDGITDLIESGCPVGERATTIPSLTSSVESACSNVADLSRNCGLAAESLRSDCTQPLDSDEDGLWDPVDPDSDDDGRTDAEEAVHFFGDADGDGLYNGRDPDADDDGVPDGDDNCWLIANADQAARWSAVLAASGEDAGTTSTESYGDACHPDFGDGGIPDWLAGLGDGGQGPSWTGESDADNDYIPDALDNCSERFNPSQQDRDGDGIGDLCDDDMDGDGFENHADVCPFIFDPDQRDGDGDGDGDRCDGDWDNDGILNDSDECPYRSGDFSNGCDEETDLSADAGVHDGGDIVVVDAGRDGDAGAEEEADRDQDQVEDSIDNCPDDFNVEQRDLDRDGEGDVCDDDDDGDGVFDESDICPFSFNPAQIDMDQDGAGDECDSDIDGDDIPNEEDACPYWPNARDDMNQVLPCGDGETGSRPFGCTQSGLGSFGLFVGVFVFGWGRKRRRRPDSACSSTDANT